MKKFITVKELMTVEYDHYHCARIISYATISNVKLKKLERFNFLKCKFINCELAEIENCRFESCTINNSNTVGKLTGKWVIFAGSCHVAIELRKTFLGGEKSADEVEFNVNWLTPDGRPVWFDYKIGKFRLAGWDHPIVEV